MSREIKSISNGPRQSNVELLRLVAMGMVLAVHADFVALGPVDWRELCESPFTAGARVMIEVSCKVCVNVFIFISGWFGIKASVKGFAGFVFQCLYFYAGLYILALLTGVAPFHPMYVARCFWFGESCWFEKSYAVLYIFSPVLNIYVNYASRIALGTVVAAFFTFQTLYGLSWSTEYLNGGYSPLSFIGIYLLAAYIKRYGAKWYGTGRMIYIISVSVNFLLYVILSRFGKAGVVLQYDNPLVVVGAAGLFLWFYQLKTDPIPKINFISRSSFAVYLFHTSPAVWTPVFLGYCAMVYERFSGIEAFGVMSFSLVCIYAAAILADQPRKLLWKSLTTRYIR